LAGNRVKSPPDTTTSARWDGLLLTIVVLIALFATMPFVEMGQIDDFSYVKTAFDFARTGHFLYNGWATAMLGWQILWGALFVKLFGYTYAATRLSTIVTSTACVWLIHAVLLRCGVHRRNAVFGTLAICLSPLFVPLSVTFMTDISGLFVILACLYCCLRALAAQRGAVVTWLVVACLIGAAGGTARQIAWMAPLVMVPSTAWILRRTKGVLITGVLSGIVTAAVIVVCTRWFKAQPYNVPEPLIPSTGSAREMVGHFLSAFLCLAFLALPVLSAWLARLLKIPGKTLAWLAVSLPTALIVSTLITRHSMLGGLMPWSGDLIVRLGILDYPNAWFVGVSPVTFNTASRIAGSLFVLAALIAFLYFLRKPVTGSQESVMHPLVAGELSWRTLGWLLIPFASAYSGLLAPRALWADILDRYLLPLLVLAVIVLLRLYQERIAQRLPLISYAVLALFAFLSIAGTHDWMAMYKARADAIQRLHNAGISSSKIQAGYEADGPVQIANAGIVIDPRVPTPPGIERTRYRPANLPDACAALFNEHTPTIHADYFLAYQVVPCLTKSEFPSSAYHTWMPPFERNILILKLQ
jgi:hypothetical protein